MGDIVLLASFEKIYLIDLKTYEVKGSFESHPKAMINSLTMVNGLIWSAGSNGEIRLWDFVENENSIVHHKTLTAHVSKINCLCTDNDGFVWSGSFDKTIIVWDSLALVPFTELDIHKDAIRGIVAVGKKVWSLGDDGCIAIWTKSNKL